MTPHTPESDLTPRTPDARGCPAPHELTQEALLALQLFSRGYTPRQIAALRRAAVVDVVHDLQGAAALLGTGTVTRAVGEARRRGLID